MAYNELYRTRVVEYILEGHTQEEASRAFKVGTTSIKRWLAAHKATGTTGGGYTDFRRPPKKIDPDKLVAYMKEFPDAFLKEIAQEFSCSMEAARKALKRNGFRLKKRYNTTKSAMITQDLRIRRK